MKLRKINSQKFIFFNALISLWRKERKEVTKPLHEFISSHIAKRTYVNMFFRGGGRMESIMLTAGNSDRKTMRHYLEIDNKEIRREMDAIFANVKL